MRHNRPDYDRIQDPTGKIPVDEPVMLFRAQDRFFPAVLRFYANLLRLNGGQEDMIRRTLKQAEAGEAWFPKKMPDLPMYSKSEGMGKLKDNLEAAKEDKMAAGAPIPKTVAGPAPTHTGVWAESEKTFVDQVLHGGEEDE